MSATLRTLSEIRATCTKAARGAGCPWGMAEEAGVAARRLASHGLAGPEALAALFDTPRDCNCGGPRGAATCGLARMAALSDAPPKHALELGEVAAPLLLIAPVLSENGSAWRVDWQGGAVSVGPDGARITGDLPQLAEVSVSPQDPPEDLPRPDWRSRPVDPESWARLEALAARTYVPETAASRAAGAGPGSADRD